MFSLQRLSILLALGTTSVTACQRHFPEYHELTSRNLATRATATLASLTEEEAILSNSFDNVSLSTWSSYYTHGAHLAGKNKTMALWTADRFNENGFSASLAEYEVLLDYPVSQSIVFGYSNGTSYELNLAEDQLPQDETTTYPNSIPAFHGYSATGDAEAEYVYVGRGHIDDFERLVQLGVDLKGKIALIKYGGLFRGLKVKNAQLHDMIACVIFSDPGSDGSVTEANGYKAYPDGPARNPSSLQRGSVVDLAQYPGDPTTPGVPSKPGVNRTDGSAVLPKIPSIPISQQNALPLLRALDGNGFNGSVVARDNWLGGLNVTYSTGPAPGATISLSNVMERVITPLWDVIGIINGTNSNETIILGNHRDAWVIGGAGDPNSGTAVLVELSRAFGKLLKTGWVPRRNIVICSWDGEEYGIIGSTEWVEEYAPWLSDTAVTYLNIDVAVSGPLPSAEATPELHTLALDTMNKIVYPYDSNTTMRDSWNTLYSLKPESLGFGDLGSGSDYTAFLQYGIGALDVGFGGGSTDPVYHYHSNYDSYHWMSTYGDPGFHTHVAVGQYLSLLTYHLADDALIPFDLNAYGRHLGYWERDLIATINASSISFENRTALNTDVLFNARVAFQAAAEKLMTYATSLNTTDASYETKVSAVNQKLRDFQRVWVKQGGLPGREFYRNIAYAPARNDGYSPQIFPGFYEAWGGYTNIDFEATKEAIAKLGRAVNEAVDILGALSD